MARKKIKKVKMTGRLDLSWGAFPYHVLLFAVYPVIFLFAYNAGEASVNDAILPFLACAASGVLLLSVSFFTGKLIKGGLVSSVLLLWFFSYGHLYRALVSAVKLKGHVILFVLTLAVAVSVIYFIFRAGKKSAAALTEAGMWMNFIAAGLILISLSGIFMKAFDHGKNGALAKAAMSASGTSGDTSGLPDIYYIVLDAHARRDYLKSIFNYDDREFEDKLKSLGFYIPEKAMSNYPETLLSFASFLNYDYLGKLQKLDPRSGDRNIMKNDIHDNRVVSYLKKKGYSYYLLSSPDFTGAIKNNANYVFPLDDSNISEFGQIFADTTAISAVSEFLPGKEPVEYRIRREMIQYKLKVIPELASLPSPKFVLDYIICPHPPFVFDENGRDVINTEPINFADGNHSGIANDSYVRGYGAQAAYIDRRVAEEVEKLMGKMNKNSIIIIHGDHGSGSSLNWEDIRQTNLGERLSIFSAYYLPNGGDKYLRPDISPVNNFRMILKNYFKENIELLPDRAYFSKWSTPFDFTDVTEYTR